MVTVRGPERAIGSGTDSGSSLVLEQTRARYPDEAGFVERQGVRVFWERYGDGEPTFLLLPTWTIIHSRHWKAQIPYLARHFRVVTFDGRGNGRSDRPQESAAYDTAEFAADAVAVLDATGTARAVTAGFSMGAGHVLRMAAEHPDRVLGAVMVGASVPFVAPRDGPDPDFEAMPSPDPQGPELWNAHVWRRDWLGFADWFFHQVYNEPHSTKQIEDTVLWASQTDPETMIVERRRTGRFRPPAAWPRPSDEPYTLSYTRRVRCPCLVIHGTDDLVSPIAIGRQLADALGAPLVELCGSGHNPLARDPVRVNLLFSEFARSITGAMA
jgi:pimeloyl-ACP methyl ester carboxylesterase